MPVIVTKNDVEYYLVPAPLVSFNKQVYNNVGRPGFGTEYSATLQGTLMPTHGNPVYNNGSSAVSNASTTWTNTLEVEPEEIVEVSGIDLLDATIQKQELIRWLFSNSSVSGVAQPIKIQIRGWDDSEGQTPADPDGSGLSFYAFVDDVSFDADSRWVNPTTYSVNLSNLAFLTSARGSFANLANEHVPSGGFHISSLTETYDFQEEGRLTLEFQARSGGGKEIKTLRKVYTVARNITAVGSPVYDETGGYKGGLSPWQQASGFIYEYLRPQDSGTLPSGKLNPTGYIEASKTYQESIDREAGSYTLNVNYLLYATGDAGANVIENVTVNHDVGENGLNTVSVQGTIQGLNTSHTGSTDVTVFNENNAYHNAYARWSGISSNAGQHPDAYYYAKAIISTGDAWLHPKELSKSFATDYAAGTITYNYTYDDRPPNLIPNAISESIQINDTYPGEIFSVTPVIGRSQPILQYLNSRSEYKRSLSINITLGGTGDLYSNHVSGYMPFGNIRELLQSKFITSKPSVTHQSYFNEIYQAANPVNDPTFTIAGGNCFHSAPTESWDPRTRNYTYNIEWTYERL
jgi:hypothetical protein